MRATGLWLCGLCAAVASGQEPAGIEVLVLDGATGASLPGVRVRIEDSAVGATTDAEGRVALGGFPAGTHVLTAEKTGYVPARVDGLALPGQDGVPVTLYSGQVVSGVLRLYPAGTLTGRLFDGNGRPFPGVTVVAFGFTYGQSGDRVAQDLARVRTNDLGEYRFMNLDAGEYALRFERTRFVAGVPDGMYPRFYYPGTTGVDRAELVEVRSGLVTRLDPVALYEAPGGTVHVGLSRSRASGPGDIVRVRVTQGGFTATSFEAPAGEIPAIGPLPPGSYDLEVVTSSGELGGMQFEVQPGADVNLTVPLTAEAAVSGRILLEDDAGDLYPVAGVEIELIDRTRWGRAFRTRRTAVSAEDGGFRFEAVPGGQYRIAFDPPSGTHVRAGQNSGDLTVDGDEVSLAIMLGSPSATLIGSLHDAAGRPVYGGIVALVPEDRSLIRLFESTRTAADGAFRFEDLAPGDYALYAWRELPGAAYRNESFMEPYESMGRPVALTPGDNLRVEMEVLEQRP